MTFNEEEPQKQGGARMIAAAEEALEAVRREPYGLPDLTSLSVSAHAITPAMAKHMREVMHFERQRAISARNVERLAEEMRRGWFLAGTPIFVCVTPEGREFIVNGNHTLEAIISSGVTVPLVLIKQRVRDIEGAARAYATFDIQQTRSWTATLQATGFSESLPMAEQVTTAVGVIMAGFGYNPSEAFIQRSRTARMEMLPEYVTASYLVADAINEAPKPNQRIVKRAAFLSVALYTARYQPSVASEFWGGMVRDDGLKANDPRKALLRYATNHPAGGSNTREAQSKAAALAWNAYFQGRTLEVCKPSQLQELRILGTPWHKGRPE